MDNLSHEQISNESSRKYECLKNRKQIMTKVERKRNKIDIGEKKQIREKT